jgi:hypothetical protein
MGHHGAFFFFQFQFCVAFLCVSQQATSNKGQDKGQGEFKNTTKKKLFWGSPYQKLLAKKVEKTPIFSVVFSLRFF